MNDISFRYELSEKSDALKNDQKAVNIITRICEIEPFDHEAVVFTLIESRLMSGDVFFKFGSKNFIEKNVSSILLTSMDLFHSCLRSVSFKTPTRYKFEESQQNVGFVTQKNMTEFSFNLTSEQTRKIETEVLNLKSIDFLQATGSFYKAVLADCFSMHPLLNKNETFRKHLFMASYL